MLLQDPMPPALDPTIRRAEVRDAPSVLSLVRRAYAKWIGLIGREPLPMTVDYDAAIRAHDIDLLYVSGELVALIEMTRASDHLYIENIAVAPEQQRQGHGHRLLNHADQMAQDGGYRQMRLVTNAAFESNIRLYHAVGFQIDRVEPFKGGSAVHMTKEISPKA